MATPTLTKHTVPGVLGELLIDVRAGGRDSPRPAVVVVHGFKGFKDWGMFPPFAERLARAGLTSVSFNLSGSGVDDNGEFTLLEQFGRSTFSADLEDLQRVLDALARAELGVAPPSAIGLVGHSRGGGTAVLQTERDRRVRALVTWAATSSVDRWSPEEQSEWRRVGVKQILNTRTGQNLPFYTDVLDDIRQHRTGRLDILGAAGRLTVPWLLVHGAKDESVSHLESEALRASSPLPATRMMLLDGAGHTFGAAHPWKGDTPELRRVFDVTLAWFATYLG